jgi:ribosomal protein S6--L-glutamate ligase
MILSFHPCFSADHQIILGARPLDEEDRRLIRSAHAVILPQGRIDGAFQECQNARAPVFPNYEIRQAYPGKVGQSRLFQTFQLPHPRTFRWKKVDALKNTPKPPHEFPFVIKDNRSHEAEGVFVVTNSDSLKEALGFLALKEGVENMGLVTQDFVSSGGNVLRAVIMGNQIFTYWKRPASPGQVITTISKGALIDHEWRPELQEKGKNQARVLAKRTGINLAAVDFIFPLSETAPEPLFLEINYYFGRRGLGGMDAYYRLLFRAIQDWLKAIGLNPNAVNLV